MEADVIVLKPTGKSGEAEVLKYRLEEGRIAGHRINVTPGDGELETETVSLIYDSLTMTFGEVQTKYESTQ